MGADILLFIKTYHDEINACTALAAVLMSVISIFFAIISFREQRNHNYQSLKPIPLIAPSDYEDLVLVTMENTGVGPLLIKEVIVFDDKAKKDSLIDWMPDGVTWENFSSNLKGYCLPAGKQIDLLRFSGDETKDKYRAQRASCRRQLAKLKITLRYTDIYDRAMPDYTRDLTWFGRK